MQKHKSITKASNKFIRRFALPRKVSLESKQTLWGPSETFLRGTHSSHRVKSDLPLEALFLNTATAMFSKKLRIFEYTHYKGPVTGV